MLGRRFRRWGPPNGSQPWTHEERAKNCLTGIVVKSSKMGLTLQRELGLWSTASAANPLAQQADVTLALPAKISKMMGGPSAYGFIDANSQRHVAYCSGPEQPYCYGVATTLSGEALCFAYNIHGDSCGRKHLCCKCFQQHPIKDHKE